MKVSTAALPFLILAAALGYLAHGSPRYGDWDDVPYEPTECCFSYTRRIIQCKNMKDYYETSSACPLPAVVFITKGGQELCANPFNVRVQYCMMELDDDY